MSIAILETARLRTLIYTKTECTNDREGGYGCDITILSYAGYTGLAIGLQHSSVIVGEAEEGFFPRFLGRSRVGIFLHGVYLVGVQV